MVESDDHGLTDGLANVQQSGVTTEEARVVPDNARNGSLLQLSRKHDREGTEQEDEEPEDAENTEETPLRKSRRKTRSHITRSQLPNIREQARGRSSTPLVHPPLSPSNSAALIQLQPVQERPVELEQSSSARVRELREQLIVLNNSDRALIQHSRVLLEDELREELLRR
ncbi:MAG: hypothetical protein LQ350_004746 [Teloschistes chrysophthalmus]|nr:MAG: hypothetical protein LQ350_004746 [Niorma chrysophthalma]